MSKITSGNPILPDFCADPSAHEWAGRYWVYPSTDEPGSTSWREMKRWHCYSSMDLLEWEDHGEIFSLEKIAWADFAAYAPDCMERGGKHYFYFPADYQIGVAVSDKPEGPFEDALGHPLLTREDGKRCGTRTMDPCIFIDEDDRVYLFFSGGHHVGLAELNADMISVKTEAKQLSIEHCEEGVWVHKYKGTYYFSYPKHELNADGKDVQHLVYSTAHSIEGPYTYHGAFLETDSRNTQHSIVEFDGQWFVFYHLEGPSPYERRVYVDRLTYDADGMIQMVTKTKEGVEAIGLSRTG